MRTFPIIQDLPDSHLKGIGSVCFEWALQERALQLIVYGLLFLSQKHGRVAVRSPRVAEQIAMIRQLMELEHLTTSLDLVGMSTELAKLEKQRDLAAHGIWLKGDNGEIYLQDVSGSWKPSKNQPKTSRRIKPEAIQVDADDLKTLARLIRDMRVITDRLANELARQRQTSPQKSP